MRSLLLALGVTLLAACSSETTTSSAKGAQSGDPGASRSPVPDTGPKDPEDDTPAPSTCTGAAGSLYALSAKRLAQTDEVKLCSLEGSVILIVNGASDCGFTGQYAPLQELYEKYEKEKFVVLAFPSDSFNQERESETAVSQACVDKYKLTFPLFSTAPVIGADAQPVYKWLYAQPGNDAPVSWNFEKFLISRTGKVVKRFDPGLSPDPASNPTIENAIKAELAK